MELIKNPYLNTERNVVFNGVSLSQCEVDEISQNISQHVLALHPVVYVGKAKRRPQYNCIICKNRVPTYCKAVGCGVSLYRECFTKHVLELTPSGNKPFSRLGHLNACQKQIHRSMNQSCNLSV